MRNEDGVVVKHIYISPHSDDVALSCGGRIISESSFKNNAIVLNIFTSDSRAAAEGADIRLFDSINADRSSEDRAAWDSIGVRADYADLPEALLRKRFPFAILSRTPDPALVERICAAIRPYIADYPDAAFHFPAGFGNHVDHLACRAAAFRLLDEGALDRILLYEDIPYSWLRFLRARSYKGLLRGIDVDAESGKIAYRRDGDKLIDYIGRKVVPFPRGRKLFSLVYASLIFGGNFRSSSRSYRGTIRSLGLDDRTMAQKQTLIQYYASQIPMLFGEEPEALLRRHRASFAQEVTIEVMRA